MSTVRKIMNLQKTEISEERKKKALAKYLSIPTFSEDDIIVNYTNSLNEYCERFKARSHDELMLRADELEFESQICNDILDKYSFLQRNKIQ